MKILRILTICICIIIILSPYIFATGSILSDGDSFLKNGKKHTNMTMDTTDLMKTSSNIYSILMAIATGVAMIVGAILGLQFMTAGVDKKVQVKESLVPYVISCVVVFGSLGIWRLVVTILQGVK